MNLHFMGAAAVGACQAAGHLLMDAILLDELLLEVGAVAFLADELGSEGDAVLCRETRHLHELVNGIFSPDRIQQWV